MIKIKQAKMPGVWQEHPYPPVVPEGATQLLIGSAPPFRFCMPQPKPLHPRDLDFYYGSSTNLFWDIILGALEPASLPELVTFRDQEDNTSSRTQCFTDFAFRLLSRHHVGLADILFSFTRRNGSAADYSLGVMQYLDLLGLIREHSSIQNIFCTSRNRVHYWLMDYLKGRQNAGEVRFNQAKDGFCHRREAASDIWSEEITIVVLPSPSARGIMRYPNRQAFLEAMVLNYRAQLTCSVQ